jgi:hypothetical protein
MNYLTFGCLVEVLDRVDLETTVQGTIRLIEPDIDNPGANWIYIRANEEALNTNQDPRIPGGYYCMMHSTEADQYLLPLNNLFSTNRD